MEAYTSCCAGPGSTTLSGASPDIAATLKPKARARVLAISRAEPRRPITCTTTPTRSTLSISSSRPCYAPSCYHQAESKRRGNEASSGSIYTIITQQARALVGRLHPSSQAVRTFAKSTGSSRRRACRGCLVFPSCLRSVSRSSPARSVGSLRGDRGRHPLSTRPSSRAPPAPRHNDACHERKVVALTHDAGCEHDRGSSRWSSFGGRRRRRGARRACVTSGARLRGYDRGRPVAARARARPQLGEGNYDA